MVVIVNGRDLYGFLKLLFKFYIHSIFEEIQVILFVHNEIDKCKHILF